MGPVIAWLAVCAGILAGCGSTAARPTRLAILPFDVVGVRPAEVAGVHRVLEAEVVRRTGVAVIDRERVAAAVRRLGPCQRRRREDRRGCATAAGRALMASHVLLGAVGGVGQTFLLQLEVVDVGRGVAQRSLEETVFGGAASLELAAVRVASRLDLPSRRPWYTRWWIWTLAGVAVTAAVVLPLALTRDDPHDDVTLP
jgi:hypothetical protein